MDKDLLCRASLIGLVRQTFSLSARESGEILESLLDAIREALAGQGQVRLRELGRFQLKDCHMRQGFNPLTGAESPVRSPQQRIAFSPSAALRRRMQEHYRRNS
ncbi:MAG: HU family DNA-binding protein [Deltaproteobacteria bacterium]|jgi:nucleoid DNA-binding protein|nr:HU family DNA-binding protein [Deltaproteobacteria bacterium]